jgi:hypothetical protein
MKATNWNPTKLVAKSGCNLIKDEKRVSTAIHHIVVVGAANTTVIGAIDSSEADGKLSNARRQKAYPASFNAAPQLPRKFRGLCARLQKKVHTHLNFNLFSPYRLVYQFPPATRWW